MDFNKADIKLQGRNKTSRKLANNTYLQRRENGIAVLLHDTDVITFKTNGDTILNSGNWHTKTTKDRINAYIPKPYQLIQEKSIWYVVKNETGYYWDKSNPRFKFQDNIKISKNGKVTNYAKDNPIADAKMKATVKKYALLCANAIPLDKPDNGDCFYCHMVTVKDNKPLGDTIKDTEHLLSHMKEKYIVPSLVLNALNEKYNAPMAIWQTFKDTGWTSDDRMFGKQATSKAVYRYIMSRLGYAS
jgi:hypothetical protein